MLELTFGQVLVYIGQAGVLAAPLLLVFIWLLYTGRLRWGRDYDKLEAEKDEWKHMALVNGHVADASLLQTRRRKESDQENSDAHN